MPLPNWRLPDLKQTIEAGTLPAFKVLTKTTDAEFYEKDPGTNYAQARYLVYYLQEHDLLVPFYRAFHENRRTDPTGYRTLKKILDENDMERFQKRWARWILEI
jgi:hypothetical protein